MSRLPAWCTAMLVGMLASGCSPTAPAGAVAPATGLSNYGRTGPLSTQSDALRTPALMTVTPNGTLKYYPIKVHGGRDPIAIGKIPHLNEAAGMAANGRMLAIADEVNQSLVLYDLNTKATQVFADPYGVPIDVA